MSKDVTGNMLYWVALIIGLLGIAGHLVTIPVVTTYAFWLVVLGFFLFLVMPFVDEIMRA